MKNLNKILSLLLAAVMLFGCLTCLTVTASAEEETTAAESGAEKAEEIDYLTKVFGTPEEKLATMKLKLTKGNYQLYADAFTGEVAVKNTVTGQILSTNPYDVGTATSSDSIKYQLLSQIIVKYLDNGKEKEFASYEYAAMRDQITVKNIKNGIRVEYIIGREEARHLLPRQIEDSRFREKVLEPMAAAFADGENNFYYKKFLAYYGGENGVKSVETQATDSLKQDLIKAFPVTAKGMAIWVFDSSASATEIEKMEELVKANCPNYSYEDMDYDHQLTEYESNETNPPVFKMALEYTLTEDGFTVRLPVNGLTYNESLYQVNNISILPYMGCGNNAYEGYVFYPDGSGTLFSMEELADVNTTSVASKVYGVDYAYHQITGTYQQTVRYPVFGVIENTQYYDCEIYNDDTGVSDITRISGLIYDKCQEPKLDPTKTLAAAYTPFNNKINNATGIEPVVESRGYTAIIEEGDALTSLVYYHSGVLSPYDTVMMNFNPRPQDSYNLADSISVGTNSEWTVTTERKYTGNFKVHYIMMTDEALAAKLTEEGKIEAGSTYAASWLGMAFAYRDYLVGKGILNKLTEEENKGDIPLYIETFGTLYTTEKIASIPVEVQKSLTSAADVITMYEELSAKGVSNINFKLTGYANGGMYADMPYRLKWTRSVQKDKNADGDKVSMQDLFNYAADVNEDNNGDKQMGVYPDFNFAYAQGDTLFDGMSLRKHAVRTIDDRKASKREYSPTQQRYVGYFQMAISPAYFNHFYEKFLGKYTKIDNATGISVASLGTALNSDFDEDEPYNREDSRYFVKKALEYMSSPDEANLDLMVEGGNVYTWQYVKHILNMSLDSSRYIKSSYSVPFIGVVLHGYMNFTGSPLNMEGDVNYAKLKCIENGASMYFTLSYKNTELLKEYFLLSHYYSVRYDIWFDDVVEIYNEVNGVLKDLKNKIIIDHEFLAGMRVPDVDELENDLFAEFEAVLDYQTNKEEYERKQQAQSVADARKHIANLVDVANDFIASSILNYKDIAGAAYVYTNGSKSMERRLRNFIEASETYNAFMAKYEAASDEEKAGMEILKESAESSYKQAYNSVKTYTRNISKIIYNLETVYNNVARLLEDAETGKLLIEGTEGIPQTIIDEAHAQLQETNELISKEIGVNFDVTIEKLRVDTYLYAHIGHLMSSVDGTDGHSQIGIIGKAENLYNLLAGEHFGLTTDAADLTILRYLDANSTLTDDELKAKYGLSEGKASREGLLKYIKEMLGDSYSFDPVLSAELGSDGMSEIDHAILNYVLNMLYEEVDAFEDSDILPTLNFVPTRVNDKKKTVSNITNINNTIKDVDSIINNKLAGAKGKIKDVTDGNYTLSNVITEDELNAIVKECVDKIKTHFLAEGATDNSKTVEYATPETLEADVREYVISFYYYKGAIQKIRPATLTDKLDVMTVPYTTTSTMTALAKARIQTYALTDFLSAVEAYNSDTALQNKIDSINGMLMAAYGDVTDELTASYLKIAAQIFLDSLEVPTVDFKANSKANNQALAAYVTELAAQFSYTELQSKVDMVVAKITEMGEADTIKDEELDLTAVAKNLLAYGFFSNAAGTETRAFYYNEQMASMDASVHAYVKTMHDAIMATLPADATTSQVYDAILKALGAVDTEKTDSTRSVAAKTKEIASLVTYYIDRGNMANDVQAYTLYLLFKSFPAYKLTDAVLPIYMVKPDADGNPVLAATTDSRYTNAINYFRKDYVQTPVDKLIVDAKVGTIRGEITDYSLSRLKTDEEMTKWAMDIFNRLDSGEYLTEAQQEKGSEENLKLMEAIKEFIRTYYYQAVMSKLSATKATNFNVCEIYGTDLYTASEQLKGLLRYYVTSFTDMTEKDIDNMVIPPHVDIDDESADPSKYLSADGRIVAVTYGDEDGKGGYVACRTFLLNYNNFSVSVVYDGVTYTIPAFDYVVVWH